MIAGQKYRQRPIPFPIPQETVDAFNARVNKQGPTPAHYECQLGRCWILDRYPETKICGTHAGYPSIRVNGKSFPAHRVSYAIHHGAFAAEMVVRHRCDNARCVRPDHLEIGTHKDNAADMMRGQFIPLETHEGWTTDISFR